MQRQLPELGQPLSKQLGIAMNPGDLGIRVIDKGETCANINSTLGIRKSNLTFGEAT